MTNYEMMLIIDAQVSEENMTEAIQKIKNIIESKQSKIIVENSWGRRKLAYPIKKKEYGLYHLFYVSGDGDCIPELETQSGYDERILKLFIVKVEDAQIANSKFDNLKKDPMITTNLLNDKSELETINA